MPIAGATSPMTPAGTLLQANTEMLMGITIAQSAFPGMPLMYAARNLIMDAWTGLGFDGPCGEYDGGGRDGTDRVRAVQMPSNLFGPVADSMVADTQSTVERTFRSIVPALCGASVIAGLGHVEHCYAYDPALLVQDDDLIGMLRRLMRGIEVSDDTLGMDAIMRVGPGGNYLIDEHTLKHFKTEYWTPKATNRHVRNAWKMKGAMDAS